MTRARKIWLALAAVIILAAVAAYFTVGRTGGGVQADRRERRAYRAAGLAGKVAASQAVLAYLRKPGPAALEEALGACLAAREKAPEDVFNNFLLAFCRHEKGDDAAEAKALSKCRPEQKAAYRFSFYEHRADLADTLHYLPAYLCVKMREAPNARDSYPPGAVCPFFGGPITRREYRSGDRTVERFICPKCDGMIEVQEGRFVGYIANRRVKKENPLLSVLPPIVNLLADRRKSRADRPDTVDKLVAALGVREGQVIADIGAGIGQFAFPFAEKVGPKGRVYAEDIDEGAVRFLKYCAEKEGFGNVVPLLGTPTDMKLPAGELDMAVLIHVYRSIVAAMDEDGSERLGAFFDGFFASIRKALKKDGTLVLVDHFDPRFGLTAETIVAELGKRDFRLDADKTDKKGRSFIYFFKKTAAAGKQAGAPGAAKH